VKLLLLTAGLPAQLKPFHQMKSLNRFKRFKPFNRCAPFKAPPLSSPAERRRIEELDAARFQELNASRLPEFMRVRSRRRRSVLHPPPRRECVATALRSLCSKKSPFRPPFSKGETPIPLFIKEGLGEIFSLARIATQSGRGGGQRRGVDRFELLEPVGGKVEWGC
jgi:hypothetical protein